MKQLFLLLLTAGAFSAAHAQQKIKLDEVAKHAGDSVTVCGKVVDARYFEQSKSGPTLINIGAAFPNQLLTVVIYKEDRPAFSYAPETKLVNQEVCVTGKIQLYREKPQIVAKKESQVAIQ
ncbi:MAG: hypothetical protein J0I41_03535 [Filimonas sp.]|nr:hypothetical protein [Filimonas sp.]